MSHSKLIEIFEQEMFKIGKSIENFQWEDKIQYGNWLAQTHYYVSHSTRLLGLAAARFGLEKNRLHLRCLEHSREEKSHEILALRDLKKIGCTLSQFPELAVTAAFYQSQYFKIEHRDPIALFGYILCLEGLSVRKGKACYDRVCSAYGKEAAVFLDVHANDDHDHLAEAFRQLEKCNAHEVTIITESLVHTSALYSQILESIATTATARDQRFRITSLAPLTLHRPQSVDITTERKNLRSKKRKNLR